MAKYRYDSNLSPTDRFVKLQIVLDSGSSITLEMGKTYELTSNERARASQRILLVPSSEPSQAAAKVQFLPVVGDISNGQVPVWSASLGAFVAGSAGGGVANARVLLWDAGSSQYLPAEYVDDTTYPREFRGPVEPITVGITLVFGDVYTPTEAPS